MAEVLTLKSAMILMKMVRFLFVSKGKRNCRKTERDDFRAAFPSLLPIYSFTWLCASLLPLSPHRILCPPTGPSSLTKQTLCGINDILRSSWDYVLVFDCFRYWCLQWVRRTEAEAVTIWNMWFPSNHTSPYLTQALKKIWNFMSYQIYHSPCGLFFLQTDLFVWKKTQGALLRLDKELAWLPFYSS